MCFNKPFGGDSDAHVSLENPDLAYGALTQASFPSERCAWSELHSGYREAGGRLAQGAVLFCKEPVSSPVLPVLC